MIPFRRHAWGVTALSQGGQGMRRRLLAVGALASLFVTVVSTSGAEAQVLDGIWVKLTVQTSGVSWDQSTNAFGKKIAFSGTCYMKIVWNPVTSLHEGRVACLWVDGLWYSAMGSNPPHVFDALADGDFWGFAQWGYFFNVKAHDFWGFFHLFLKPVVKNGVLKQINVTGEGLVEDGELGTTGFWGPYAPYKIKGIAVAESKVPAEVVALFP